ncbi:MAG: thiamine-phosphate kinase [Candidatus Margulisiibacteriota bacterium]
MKLTQLGEFGLIDRISRREHKRSTTLIGIGDDAAVLKFPGKYLLITTDTFIENIHFRLKNTSFFPLGQKVLAANISDIAAMGGWPTHALVTIGLPKTISVKAVDELYRGIDRVARKFKIDIIGGDTVQSPKEIVISVVLLGEVERDNLLLRSTARVGDAILVTGYFGGQAATHYEISNQLPVIRIKEARTIARLRMATAMIDSSDGLVRSVLEICKASKVGARIWLDMVPIAKGANLDQALYGGEEYELVFTVPKAEAMNLAEKIQKKTKTKVSIVGEIVASRLGVKLVNNQGRVILPKSGGYEHFR